MAAHVHLALRKPRQGNRNAIYLCEQAAEKIIRAVLTSEGKHAGIRHELRDMISRNPTSRPRTGPRYGSRLSGGERTLAVGGSRIEPRGRRTIALAQSSPP